MLRSDLQDCLIPAIALKLSALFGGGDDFVDAGGGRRVPFPSRWELGRLRLATRWIGGIEIAEGHVLNAGSDCQPRSELPQVEVAFFDDDERLSFSRRIARRFRWSSGATSAQIDDLGFDAVVREDFGGLEADARPCTSSRR